MNPLARVARWLMRPLCWLADLVLVGHTAEDAETQARPPSVRFVDIDAEPPVVVEAPDGNVAEETPLADAIEAWLAEQPDRGWSR